MMDNMEWLEDLMVSNAKTTFFLAKVVDNNSPDGKGKIKVRIPGLHGIPSVSPTFVKDSDLPWASPANLSQSVVDSRQYDLPRVGSVVYVTFLTLDESHIIYFGVLPT